MKKSTQISFLFPLLILISVNSFGQLCSGGGAPSTVTLNLTGRNSVREYNHNNNIRGTLTAAFSGDIVGVNFSGVNLTTFSPSWCEEAEMAILDARNGNGVTLAFSADQNGSPCSDLPFSGFFDLVDLGLEFATGAGGSIYWELYETLNDIGGADATYTAGTVTIYVCPTGQALPLELKSFTGKTESTSNTLLWETLTEKNVQSHIVERSVDGIKWMEVGKTAGQMDSQSPVKYELEDRAPLAKAYYRLRSVDYDGAENFSNTIVLTRKGEHFGIAAAFPSPTKDQVTVQFTSLTEENVTIRVMDISGRLVLVQEYAADNGINEAILQLDGLQAGVYLVRISNATSTAEPMRIVKE